MRIKGYFKVLGAIALTIYVVLVFVTGPARNRETLGTFSPESRQRIERELSLLCEQLAQPPLAKCGPVDWSGKHRWFGRVALSASLGRPPETVMVAFIDGRGWRRSHSMNDEVLEYWRDDMLLSLHSPIGGVRAISVTTMAPAELRERAQQ
jgi:hypothetical protein